MGRPRNDESQVFYYDYFHLGPRGCSKDTRQGSVGTPANHPSRTNSERSPRPRLGVAHRPLPQAAFSSHVRFAAFVSPFFVCLPARSSAAQLAEKALQWQGNGATELPGWQIDGGAQLTGTYRPSCGCSCAQATMPSKKSNSGPPGGGKRKKSQQ